MAVFQISTEQGKVQRLFAASFKEVHVNLRHTNAKMAAMRRNLARRIGILVITLA